MKTHYEFAVEVKKDGKITTVFYSAISRTQAASYAKREGYEVRSIART